MLQTSAHLDRKRFHLCIAIDPTKGHCIGVDTKSISNTVRDLLAAPVFHVVQRISSIGHLRLASVRRSPICIHNIHGQVDARLGAARKRGFIHREDSPRTAIRASLYEPYAKTVNKRHKEHAHNQKHHLHSSGGLPASLPLLEGPRGRIRHAEVKHSGMPRRNGRAWKQKKYYLVYLARGNTAKSKMA